MERNKNDKICKLKGAFCWCHGTANGEPFCGNKTGDNLIKNMTECPVKPKEIGKKMGFQKHERSWMKKNKYKRHVNIGKQ